MTNKIIKYSKDHDEEKKGAIGGYYAQIKG